MLCHYLSVFSSFNISMLKTYKIYDPPSKNILTLCMWHVKENVKSDDSLFSSRYSANSIYLVTLNSATTCDLVKICVRRFFILRNKIIQFSNNFCKDKKCQ